MAHCWLLLATASLILWSCDGERGEKHVIDERGKRFLLEDSYETIMRRLNEMNNTIAVLTTDNAAMKQAQASTNRGYVAFRATLSASISAVGAQQTIKYDQVQLNEGDAYHSAHGTFFAPRNGIYMFSVKACTIAGHQIALDLMMNTTVVGKIWASDPTYGSCATDTEVLKLSPGDEVYVNHRANGYSYLLVDPNSPSSFTGSLLPEQK